jgi:hypothetical protein
MAIPPTPLTDAEVAQTVFHMDETIRYRLRLKEIVPVEMSRYYIGKFGKPLSNPTSSSFPPQPTAVFISVSQSYLTPLYVFEAGTKAMAGFSFTLNF